MATITIPNFNTPKVVDGLNSYQYTSTTAGMHVARARVSHLPTTGMSISINQNSVSKAAVTLANRHPSTSQSNDVLMVTINCAVNDVIEFALTSFASEDNQSNTIKAELNIHQGSGN